MNTLIILTLLTLGAMAYAQYRLPYHVKHKLSGWFARLLLITVGAAFGYVLAFYYYPVNNTLQTLLIFLSGFGLVHVPTACILFLKRQQKTSLHPQNRSRDISQLPQFSAPYPEQASHNLEYSDQSQRINPQKPPARAVEDADFAAEAHGFTGFERVGKGASYKSS